MTAGNDGFRPDSPAERAPRAGALRSAVLGVRLATEIALIVVLAIVGASATSLESRNAPGLGDSAPV